MDRFEGRLGLQQRVLPAYRAPFFDALAAACSGGLSVFAGQPRSSEGIAPAAELKTARLVHTRNWNLLSGSFYLCYQPGLPAWLADWQPDVLILEANPRYLGAGRAIEWMHSRLRPVLGWGLGSPRPSGPLAGWRERSRRRLIRQFDALITYSRKGADEYRAAGFPAEKIFIAPNAVTSRPTQPPPANPAAFSGQPLILFVGRMQERKRLDLLLRACAALPIPLQPRLWIVGEGPARGGFESLARQVYPQAEFLGPRYGAELESCFAAADLFVLPGTGGLAVQQAMAHGLPVVVSEADGTQVDLVHAENGWQAVPGDLASLTAILREALSSPERLRQMGAASYRIVAEEINLENMVEVFLRAIASAFASFSRLR
ncbi:MAG TPA: glycosyltransferase [Anaerolineaceae bacterium]|nr:glycosyltransferase [Anaerolineaceae bacterium]